MYRLVSYYYLTINKLIIRYKQQNETKAKYEVCFQTFDVLEL